jgi:beta-phosphoglucomutase-like phosphatase (HAD superfamily)
MGFSKKEMEEKGFTTEQIDFVMAERGKEIEKEKTKLDDLQKQLADKDASITELAEKAKNLDGTESTLKELQEKIAIYEKSESDRIESEKVAKLNAELMERFNAIKGEQKFNHELVEKGRFEEFKNALQDEQFKGKGDSDIFGAIVKPEDLVNPQRQVINMPGGNILTGNLDGVEKAFMQRNPNIKF